MEGLIEGRIVHYVLNDNDAGSVNQKRAASFGYSPDAPKGAQMHLGNRAMAGEHCPAIVVRVWPHEYGDDKPGANLQVFLDGNDSLWVTSAKFAEPEAIELGTWHWVEKA